MTDDHSDRIAYTRLGRTALRVSRLGVGAWNFGWVTPEPEAMQMMDVALDRGINLIDTADVYTEGESERIIGRWLAQGGGRREKVVLATKVFYEMSDWPNDGGLSARHIRDACDASLKRLQTDHIDLFQMHHVDRSAPWDEIWQAMEQLVQQGKVIYVGSSNFAGWHIARASETARRRNLLGLVSEQSVYNLTKRDVELEVLPACEAYGLGFLPYSPLGGGALAGRRAKPTEGRLADESMREHFVGPFLHRADKLREVGERLDAYEALCVEIGKPPADVALAWLLAQPQVTAPIIGPRTTAHLEGSLRALELELDGELLERLDAIFPGPGGPAPEAYAW